MVSALRSLASRSSVGQGRGSEAAMVVSRSAGFGLYIALWTLGPRSVTIEASPGHSMSSSTSTLDLDHPAERPLRPLVDPFARAITYLRVSVTDRCDFRCVYCMSEHMSFLPKADLLT